MEVDGKRAFRDFDNEYFIIASGVGFSISYLDEVSLSVTIGKVSFEKISEIYNYKHALHGTENCLDTTILEENWLLYRILSLCKNVKWDRKMENNHYHTEKICLSLYPDFKEKVDYEWLHHICDEVGCKNRIVVIDGNEKLYRYCCSAPFEKTKNDEIGTNITKRCINNPKRGNQSVRSSKKCELHFTGIEGPVHTVEQIDLRPVTRQLTRNLKEQIVSGVGCKSINNINKFEERTAGMLYLLRPCGIRLSHTELYTAESLSSVFSSLIDVFGNNPSKNEISGVVYDRSCDLKPCIHRLSEEGHGIAEPFNNIRYIVDPFHAEKHTLPKCDITNKECKYHPDLEIYKDVRNMNMEICEQTFHLINPLKHISRNMTYGKRLFAKNC